MVQHYKGKKLLIIRCILWLETTQGYQKLSLCVLMSVQWFCELWMHRLQKWWNIAVLHNIQEKQEWFRSSCFEWRLNLPVIPLTSPRSLHLIKIKINHKFKINLYISKLLLSDQLDLVYNLEYANSNRYFLVSYVENW